MRLPAARLPITKRAAGAARHDDTVERAFELAAADPARLDDLLGALRLGWLWVPLPDDGAPVTDGSAVQLPTVRYLGDVFIPAYTSAPRLQRAVPDPPEGRRTPVIPHVVVRAADLARRLPPDLGIALNPGSPRSIPVSPAGVGEIAAEHATVGGCRVSVGPPPAIPPALLAAVAASLRPIAAAREAATAWLTVHATPHPAAAQPQPGQAPAAHASPGQPPAAQSADQSEADQSEADQCEADQPEADQLRAGQAGAGMIISVRLDDPADAAVRDAVIAAVQGAVAAPGMAAWPVDVTFPGEGEPDIIDRWVAAAAAPFYQRDLARIELPAPRRPAS
ncbi:MAG TPA: SseB family protein [Streptosporangiaceae bacterium]|nr:SseB family protein [Streptosporangiaceae bacterium]